MIHSSIRTAIETWITAVIGSDLKIYWSHRPRGYDQGRIICQIINEIPAGRDAVKWTYDSGAAVGQEMTPKALGNRTFTLQIRAETYSASTLEDSKYYTSQLLGSLALPTTKSTFKDASIGYRTTLSHTTLDVVKMQREISTTILELSFHADSSQEGTAIGYAEKWGVTSDLDGIAASKNIDELLP